MSNGQILMNKVIFFSLQQRRFEQLNSESDKYESDLRNNSGLYGIWTLDLYETSAVSVELTSQLEVIIMLVNNKPVKW